MWKCSVGFHIGFLYTKGLDHSDWCSKGLILKQQETIYFMRKEALHYICCLVCQHKQFLLDVTEQQDVHIMEGLITCEACKKTYPIIRGIPRFLPGNLDESVKNNVSSFGKQWKKYHQQLPQNKVEFESYFEDSGLTPEHDFKNKVILDAGCGSGKFASISGQYENVQLLGMDLSESVEVAFRLTSHLPGTHIIQADILNPPLKANTFDLIYSIGVLHHTYNPPGSFHSLSRFLKPAGHFFFWLYAKEGNRLYLTLFDPIRVHVTRHLPLALNNLAAWIIAILTWPLVLFYAFLQHITPLHLFAKQYLPLYTYLLYFHQVGFWLWRNTILDKIIPHIAYHYSQEELKTWLNGFSLRSMTFRNGNSWGVLSQKDMKPSI